jgi:FtsP/CotA-like multicopper oxidase with cupredoxin domain
MGRYLVMVVVLASCSRSSAERSVRVEDELRKQFEGSYKAEAPPSTSTKTFQLEAAPAEVNLFEGRALKVWAYNKQVPGPILRVRLGETVHIPFRNNLPQPTTIHFHGVRVPNAMDGVPGVTQPPIPPGGTFTYHFTPKDAGTFWFHPHVRGSEQVERGLFGILVVDDAEPRPYTRDVVWVLDDWRLGRDGQIDPRFVTRGDLMHDGRWGRTITVNGSTQHELTVPAGARIRLRMVNTANGRPFQPNFTGLDAKVIAVDGMYTARPLSPKGFVLAPGNRLDLDITFPKSQAGAVFPIVDQFTRRDNKLATIRVSPDETVPTPTFATPARAFVPGWKKAIDAPVHTLFALNVRRGGKHGLQWLINGRAYPNHDPKPLPHNEWVKLRFRNDSVRIHPMHIHGQFFKVISRNGEPVDEPYFRDTVLLRARETVDVGLVPLDEGDWMLHCHILEHAESGMMTVVHVRRRKTAAPHD